MSSGSLASRQGALFEQVCALILEDYFGEKPVGPVVLDTVGVEIDFEVGGIWFECKGSWLRRPGLHRTDTVKKALWNGAAAASLDDAKPYVVLTTHLPKDDLTAAKQIAVALAAGYVAAVVNVNEPGELEAVLDALTKPTH